MLWLGFVLALAVGAALGILGGGGGILMLPLLVYALGVAPKDAIATSLFVVGATSGTALLVHARAGRVRYKIGAIFGLAAMFGAFLGGRAAAVLPEQALLFGFGLIMLVAATLIFRKRINKPAIDQPVAEPAPASVANTGSLARILVLGFLVGGLAGMVGAGGGFLIVPALSMLGGLALREAIGTSLMVICLQSFAGFFGHMSHANLDPRLIATLTIAAILGSTVGAAMTADTKPALLQRSFAWLVLGMGFFLCGKQLVGK